MKNLFIILIALVSFQACKKDPLPTVSPEIKLLTEKSWKLFTYTDEFPDDCQLDDILTFNTDGNCSYSINGTVCYEKDKDSDGSWTISEDKKEAIFNIGDKSRTFTIALITDDRLELRLEEYYFVYLHDNVPNPIKNKAYLKGTWKMHISFGKEPDECDFDDTYLINEDNTFEYNLGTACSADKLSGNWQLDERQQTINWIGSGDEIYAIYTILNLTEDYLDLYDFNEETSFVLQKVK